MKRVEIIIRTINGDTPPTEKIVAELTASGNKIEVEQSVYAPARKHPADCKTIKTKAMP